MGHEIKSDQHGTALGFHLLCRGIDNLLEKRKTFVPDLLDAGQHGNRLSVTDLGQIVVIGRNGNQSLLFPIGRRIEHLREEIAFTHVEIVLLVVKYRSRKRLCFMLANL